MDLSTISIATVKVRNNGVVKGRLHTDSSNVLEIGKDEIFLFRQGVKRRARETHDNPHNIIAEATSNLSETAKTLLPPEKSLKKLCHGARPTPSSANPKSLCDLQIDENFSTLGGKNS